MKLTGLKLFSKGKKYALWALFQAKHRWAMYHHYCGLFITATCKQLLQKWPPKHTQGNGSDQGVIEALGISLVVVVACPRLSTTQMQENLNYLAA